MRANLSTADGHVYAKSENLAAFDVKNCYRSGAKRLSYGSREAACSEKCDCWRSRSAVESPGKRAVSMFCSHFPG